LDALRDHLGIVHGLADTGLYTPITIGCGPDKSLRFSRKCRHVIIPNWRWNLGDGQLTSHFERAQRAVLLPVSIRAVEWAIRNREALSQNWQLVPLPTPGDFDIANDKVRLADFAQRFGLSVPPMAHLAGSVEAASELRYPVLLKPRCGYGGSGIVLFDTPQSLVEHLSGMTSKQNYFAQTMIDGHDVSCGVYCRNGQVLASVTYVPLARESRFGRFTSIETIDDPCIEGVVGQLMKALRWNGIANIDLIRSKEGRVYVLEVNPRCWGNMAAVIPLGLDFASMLCQAAVGRSMTSQRCRRGRIFGALDTIALLREMLFNRSIRQQLDWRRMLGNESSLRTMMNDPFPWLFEAFRHGPFRGTASLLRQALRRDIPALEGKRIWAGQHA
jgi:predicted ATP-grasp superfamily ATP-dependent carboligase